MDEKRMQDIIDTFMKSKIDLYAYLSKDKDDNWTVTKQLYNMSDNKEATERISTVEHTIANKPGTIKLDQYSVGQKVYGELLQDNTFYLSCVCVDTKNYDI
jgi:hypothetical protein